MRIAFVSTMAGAPWGGSEELWAAACKSAPAAKHEVLVCVYDHGKVPQQVTALERLGARIDYRRRPIHHKIDRPLAKLGLRFGGLRRFKPDAVCVSQGESYDLVTDGACQELRRWLESERTPLVIICQLNYECPSLNDRRRRELASTFASASSVCFVARRNLLQARRHLACDLSNGVVVRNPVNLASTEAVPWPEGSRSRLNMAGVARLDVVFKGQDALLEALGDPIWKSREWSLDFYGSGNDGEYLRSLIAHYGLADKARIAGHVADVRSIWARHAMLALPSRQEGTPLAMVEAMVCGRPALVTDVAGNTEWIREGESGFVAADPNPAQLHAALERAWSAREQLETLGQAARRIAMQQIDPNPGGTIVQLIQKAAGGRFQP